MSIEEIVQMEVGRVLTNPALLSELLKAYKKLFNIKDNQINASCDKCLRDYFNQVKIKVMAKDKTGIEFKLINDNSGNSISIRLAFGSSDFYTNDNLTEEVALEYLSKNPNRVNQFSEVPKDWEERLKGKKPAKKKATKKKATE